MVVNRTVSRVLEFVGLFRCATIRQIADLFYHGSIDYAQRRMKQLHNLGMVQRFYRPKPGFDELVYCPSTVHRLQAEHYLMVTQAYIDLRKLPGQLTFQPLYSEEFSYQGKAYRFTADALVLYRSRSGFILFFLEVERRPIRRRRYDKVAHYEAYLQSGAWRKQPWSQGGRLYPAVVVMGSASRLTQIQRAISRRETKVNWLWRKDDEPWDRMMSRVVGGGRNII